MTAWFTTPETTPKSEVADNLFVGFVARNYKPPATFLDIGSGSGANSRYLKDKGFTVVTLDAAPQANADICADVNHFFARPTISFDCIFDINTLCHVEQPPYEGIAAACRKFFSIHPADDTELDLSGKGYVRRADHFQMLDLVRGPFTNVSIRKVSYWVIEATK